MPYEKLTRHLFVGRVAVLVACGAFAVAGENDGTTRRASDVVMKAYAARMDGKVDEAKRVLEERLAAEPGDAAAWLELARLELERSGRTRELESAQKAIAKAVHLDPDDPVYQRWAARIAMLDGILRKNDRSALEERFKKAIAAAERAVTLAPGDHEARRILVSLYGNNPPALGGDRSRARSHVEELERRSPIDGAAARCEFSHHDDSRKKLALWRDLAANLDRDPRVHAHLALEHAWSGDVEQAALHADRALALDPTRGRVLLDLARAFALEKKPEPAERFARRYLALVPPPPRALRAWAHMALGQIQKQNGDTAAATESLAQAKKLDPYCWFTMTPPPEELFTPPAN